MGGLFSGCVVGLFQGGVVGCFWGGDVGGSVPGMRWGALFPVGCSPFWAGGVGPFRESKGEGWWGASPRGGVALTGVGVGWVEKGSGWERGLGRGGGGGAYSGRVGVKGSFPCVCGGRGGEGGRGLGSLSKRFVMGGSKLTLKSFVPFSARGQDPNVQHVLFCGVRHQLGGCLLARPLLSLRCGLELASGIRVSPETVSLI